MDFSRSFSMSISEVFSEGSLELAPGVSLKQEFSREVIRVFFRKLVSPAVTSTVSVEAET